MGSATGVVRLCKEADCEFIADFRPVKQVGTVSPPLKADSELQRAYDFIYMLDERNVVLNKGARMHAWVLQKLMG